MRAHCGRSTLFHPFKGERMQSTFVQLVVKRALHLTEHPAQPHLPTQLVTDWQFTFLVHLVDHLVVHLVIHLAMLHLAVSTPGHPAVHLALAAYLALVHLAVYLAPCFAVHMALDSEYTWCAVCYSTDSMGIFTVVTGASLHSAISVALLHSAQWCTLQQALVHLCTVNNPSPGQNSKLAAFSILQTFSIENRFNCQLLVKILIQSGNSLYEYFLL